MLVLIGALIIVAGAFAVASIDEFVYNQPLAIVLQILLIAAESVSSYGCGNAFVRTVASNPHTDEFCLMAPLTQGC